MTESCVKLFYRDTPDGAHIGRRKTPCNKLSMKVN